MPLNLRTVQGYVTGIRGLLQDTVQPYRYSDNAILAAMNLAFMEGRRLRADIFMHSRHMTVPHYEEVNGDIVPIEDQFRLAFEYGAAAHVLLRDVEDVQDERAASFNAGFHEMLVGIRTPAVTGGTPTPQQAGAKRAPAGP